MIRVSGQAELQAKISKMQDAPKVFDKDVADTAIFASRDLKDKTPKLTGNLARNWTAPEKIKNSHYAIENNVTTESGIPLALILNNGRGEITPKNASVLRIPFTNKGRAGGGQFGVDFIFAKKSKAVKGTEFIDTATQNHAKILSDKIIKRIEAIHG